MSTATSGVRSTGRAQLTAKTLRTDRWWQPALLTDLGLLAFVVYATARAFMGADYFVDKYHYLTPFYSPCVSASCEPAARHFGTWVGHLPGVIPLGFLALPFLLVFRLTCYYYRKAYYRSVVQAPTACAVAEPRVRYFGESRMPMLIQNVHRYFFYIALLFTLVNTYDAIRAFHSPTGFGFGLGNLILVANVALLWCYTISCHSCRHVTGGRLKHFSAHPVRYWIWTQISKLNTRHMEFAWFTLLSLTVTDLYIFLVSSGTIGDLRFIG